MIGIEVFSGPGGMSLGAKSAGIDIKIAVEKDYYAAQTYAKNHKGTTVVVDDISNVKEFVFERENEGVVLFGGPPCQGYSNSNQKNKSKDNPKNWLFKEFIRCTKLIRPDWIVIENVKGLLNLEKGFFLNEIFKDLNDLGYTVNYKILNSVDFGVPQKRERIFIVGSRHGIAFDFPSQALNSTVTVGDALSDLPKLVNGQMSDKLQYLHKPKSTYAKLMRGNLKEVKNNYVSKNSDLVVERYSYVPQGGNWKNIPDNLMSNYKDHSRCHGGIYRRLSNDNSSVVIGNYRKNMLIHPTQNRGLSVREAARLQSFPDSFEFLGPINQQQQQVGDAVPPLLAKAIFDKLMQYNI
ncbi:DNA cytosine methyltransferase [Epilithonimonas sp.]|uniref:DNA cytosine methyltransferase n=1 Tax=Epilithonimonas sp. TaxID=2894511 RepID=UPI0028AD1208|nr:DNA cytosine methyltransferase [Epilithonimonas sp.]